MAKTEVATASANALVSTDDLEQFAGEGLENVTASDILIPRLAIMQALSPYVKKNNADYIEGAEPGMIADVGTGQLIGEHMDFLPVHYSKIWIEWAPRSSGKGLVAIHDTDAILKNCEMRPNQKGTLKPHHGENMVVETAQFFGFNMSAGGRASYIPMSSSQIKAAKKWNTLASGLKWPRKAGGEFTPALYTHIYRLSVVTESKSGDEWFGWKVDHLRNEDGSPVTILQRDDGASLIEQSKAFIASLKAGEARAEVVADDEVPF